MSFLTVREHAVLSAERWLRIVIPPSPNPFDCAVDEIFGESRCERIALTAQPNLLGYVVIVRDTTVTMKVVLILHCCILLTEAVRRSNFQNYRHNSVQNNDIFT